MDLYNDINYIADIDYVSKLQLPWEKIKGSKILLSGASGMVGSFLVDTIMKKNEEGLDCTIYAICRNTEYAKSRFSKWFTSKELNVISGDINSAGCVEVIQGDIDYVIHMASNTHPVLYATNPIETIKTNIFGTDNLLRFAVEHNAKRFLFLSSNEIYGENRGDTELFDEAYCGYIDPNTLRAGYPESKRCGEALCQAYRKECRLDVVICRLTRTYGPTMKNDDSKVISQFIKNAVKKEDIVLKSEGKQYYSFIYVADAVSGLLTVLLLGENGEAYNISDLRSDITIRDLAELTADLAGKKVVFDIPSETEKSGFSKATKARLNSRKINDLGWKAKYSINEGLSRTIEILSVGDN